MEEVRLCYFRDCAFPLDIGSPITLALLYIILSQGRAIGFALQKNLWLFYLEKE